MLLRSTTSDNIPPSNDPGGGILKYQQAILTVSDSAISNNTIGSHSAGIANFESAVTLANSTASGNTAHRFSGGGAP